MSHILSDIIRKKLPQWNKRIFARYEEAAVLCSEAGVGLVEARVRYKGEYTVHRDVPVIVIQKQLREPLKLWVLLHELGHHLLHFPATHRFSKSVVTKADREANFFAAVAMMPTDLCRAVTPAEIEEHYGFEPEIIRIRREISENYRI